MEVAILGVGNLGSSIAQGILSNGLASQLYLTKRNLKSLDGFKNQQVVKLSLSNEEAVSNSKILILAVQPIHIVGVLKQIKALLRHDHMIISTVTGYSIKQIENILGNRVSIIRSMPNTAIAVGKSMTCMSANDEGMNQIQKAQDVFNKLGASMVISENQMQAATVVCASGIAFWMRLIKATTQAGIQLGLEAKESMKLAIHTCEGAASLLIHNGLHPEEEIDQVTTPMGCTIEGLNEMEHQGLSSSLIKGMVTSYDKINSIKEV